MQDRIKKLRKYLQLTQSEFGARIGVSDAAVAHWERGRQVVPAPILISLCREFNVNREWLETGVGEMFLPVVSEDTASAQRRFIGEIFDSLPVDKQRIILDALRSAFSQYLDDKKPGASTSNSVSITAPIGGGVTIDQKIETKE